MANIEDSNKKEIIEIANQVKLKRHSFLSEEVKIMEKKQ